MNDGTLMPRTGFSTDLNPFNGAAELVNEFKRPPFRPLWLISAYSHEVSVYHTIGSSVNGNVEHPRAGPRWI